MTLLCHSHWLLSPPPALAPVSCLNANRVLLVVVVVAPREIITRNLTTLRALTGGNSDCVTD